MHVAATRMQALWRGVWGRKQADYFIERLLAARTIQRKYRARFARKLMAQIREKRRRETAAIAYIQRPAHVWLAVRKVERVRQELRATAEKLVCFQGCTISRHL